MIGPSAPLSGPILSDRLNVDSFYRCVAPVPGSGIACGTARRIVRAYPYRSAPLRPVTVIVCPRCDTYRPEDDR